MTVLGAAVGAEGAAADVWSLFAVGAFGWQSGSDHGGLLSRKVTTDLGRATVAYERGRKRSDDTPGTRQAAIAQMLTSLMKRARLYREGENRVESIREWVAFRVFADTNSVEAVAQRLVMSSLDAAAHIVGYDWVAETRIDVPLPLEPGAG